MANGNVAEVMFRKVSHMQFLEPGVPYRSMPSRFPDIAHF